MQGGGTCKCNYARTKGEGARATEVKVEKEKTKTDSLQSESTLVGSRLCPAKVRFEPSLGFVCRRWTESKTPEKHAETEADRATSMSLTFSFFFPFLVSVCFGFPFFVSLFLLFRCRLESAYTSFWLCSLGDPRCLRKGRALRTPTSGSAGFSDVWRCCVRTAGGILSNTSQAAG